ncbi:MAG: DNA repair protein RecN [Fermentimonas sp.]|jgi:DNA repair protein RecN (Recombination protein N)|nr:DNA repair protein RecN [Fermentimonas sp.]HBT84635.1 DNA repair protein RecN [Porphyromonadaceae bacterium]MDD2930602.1 DNA repair protein RecN [Fermentimonas sp.]MDD3511043.1 DNA repair protein RecN [Fermentimonas sp.]MDD4283376.1 DNA repair protein RecN [Fermentimonas sp.]
MLKSLSIENYALIDSINIAFDKGLTVITGETGAGKSIILGALSLILGQRADSRHIKQGENKCLIEGLFDISSYNLKSFFKQRDWEYDETECILRREIWSNGKSRAFVNDSPVYLNDLKELGDRLIDIHSQHQNLALNDNLFQLNVVDTLAATEDELSNYEKAYTEYHSSLKELNDLLNQYQKNKEEEDYLRFQHKSLSDASLKPGEQEQLEEELEALTHSEEIKSGLFAVIAMLSEDEKSIESLLKTTKDRLQIVQNVYPKVTDLTERVRTAYIDLKDVREEASRYFEDIDFDPERQQLIEDRLSTIYGLQKKHSVTTVDELILLRDEIAVQIQNVDSLDERLSILEKETSEKRSLMLEKGRLLSNKRKNAVPEIEKQLIDRLTYLKITNSRFKCEFKEKTNPDSTGIDNLEFLFSANKNTALQPVSEVASGGEISRLMLCLKAMIAGATALPTIIFDEIDTGTSGDIADRVGTIMRQMSREMQVIAITHLPQIASKGDEHLVVYKEETQNGVNSNIKVLTNSERVEEIAQMLSGAEITLEAIENAKAILGKQSE